MDVFLPIRVALRDAMECSQLIALRDARKVSVQGNCWWQVGLVLDPV